ncbi:hypothetical protein BaRGS_00027900, partial [Batillaria attramentaria]
DDSEPEPPATVAPAPSVYPTRDHNEDDRIVAQLEFLPPHVEESRRTGQKVQAKTLLAYEGLIAWGRPSGDVLFREQNCTVKDCVLSGDRQKLDQADVVVFHLYYTLPQRHRQDQAQHMDLLSSDAVFNWTATYRRDSTIVAPYEKYVPLNAHTLTRTPTRNYAHGKTKQVAWFVSHCGGHREEYALELARYIRVDIYGICGPFSCDREDPTCFEMLSRDYKFYLAFENSNCRDYITEKFFVNGLQNDVIPVVMGAAPEDYARAAPPHSFIHVDEFQSPEHLANYLHQLDRDDQLYNGYFAWKGLWTMLDTRFWCRMCALAHDVERRGPSWYADFLQWWNGPGVCIPGGAKWEDSFLNRSAYDLIGQLAVGAGDTETGDQADGGHLD